MRLKRTDIDTTVEYATKTRAALVVERWRSEVRIACVNRWATWQQRVGKGPSTVVLQRTEHRVRIDLIAWASQITAAIIAANVIAVRADGTIYAGA